MDHETSLESLDETALIPLHRKDPSARDDFGALGHDGEAILRLRTLLRAWQLSLSRWHFQRAAHTASEKKPTRIFLLLPYKCVAPVMAPTLRSNRHLETDQPPVTRTASSQVMSPTKAQTSTSAVNGGYAVHDQGLTNDDQEVQRLAESGRATGGQDDATLSHGDAEHLIRSLAGIPGGCPLIRVLLVGLQTRQPANPDSHSVENPPPQRQADDAEPCSLDNMNPGGRYDDNELTDHTKALRNSPSIKLPKLHSRNDVPLHFETCTLGDIMYGCERNDLAEGLRCLKYNEWYRARKNKAFSALALSLLVDLRKTFKIDDIRDNMDAAAMVYTAITQHLEAGDGINPDSMLQDLVVRRLQPNESVTAYVEDIGRKVTLLRQANGEFEEWQHASLLLSNSVLVFHDLAREHADWINNHDRRTMKLAEALQRLRSAEHQRDQLQLQTRTGQPRQLNVAHVTAGQAQGKHRKRSKQQRKRIKGVTDKKQRTNCANCHGDGHWYAEYTEHTGLPLRADLVKKAKAKQKKRTPM